MKQIFFLLIIFPVLSFGQDKAAVNSFKELDKTLAVFLDRILVQKQDPDSLFLLTKEEMARLTAGKRTASEVEQRYTEYLKKTGSSFEKFELKQGFRKKQITDTLTFHLKEWNTGYQVLTVFVHFTDDTTHYAYPTIYKEQFVEFNFAVIDDHIRLLEYRVKSSKSDVTDRRRDNSEGLAELRITDPQYLRFGFGYEKDAFLPGAIPFRKNGKWGFMSPDNKVLFPAVCDSVYRSQSGYTKIAINGRYNLVDGSYNRVFGKEVKTIEAGPFYFTSPGSDKLQPFSYFTKYKDYVKLPETYTFADSIRRIKTAYVFSDNGTGFRALKPFLEVAGMTMEKPEPDHSTQEGRGSCGSVPMTTGDKNSPRIVVEDVPFQTSLFRETIKLNPPQETVPASEYSLAYDYSIGRKLMYWSLLNKNGDTLQTFTGWTRLALIEGLLYGKRNDTSYVMEPGGTVLFRTDLYCSELQDEPVIKIFDPSTGLLGAYFLKTRKAVPVQYRSIRIFPGMLKVITQDYRFGFVNGNGDELFD